MPGTYLWALRGRPVANRTVKATWWLGLSPLSERRTLSTHASSLIPRPPSRQSWRETAVQHHQAPSLVNGEITVPLTINALHRNTRYL